MIARWTTVSLVVLATACSSVYTPRRSPRVAMLMDGGRITYVRDGRSIDDGFLGGGLVEAVAGDREAEDLADTYASRRAAGFVLSLTSLACVGFIPLQDPAGLDDLETAFGITLACVAALSLTGAFVTVSGLPYQYDAINVFNDHVDLRLGATAQPVASPGLAPTPAP